LAPKLKSFVESRPLTTPSGTLRRLESTNQWNRATAR
jgi:hypothetical protein